MTMHYLAVMARISILLLLATDHAAALVDPPYLSGAVQSNRLPPVELRVPSTPLVMDEDMNNTRPGRHGGTLRMLMGKEKDIRRMVVFGYSRLVGFSPRLDLVPDIVRSFEVREGREFIFRLRKGHRWSDGAPFTSEDFRFYWEDVVNNEDLHPFGPPQALRVDGELPSVSFPDAHTVVYRWSRPNPDFLTGLAAPRPLFIYMPRHYLEQFHPGYRDPELLDRQARERGSRNWAGYFLRKARQYKLTNPDLPSLQPWTNTTAPPSELYTFKRNPYFHRVDRNGLQLPYIDEVVISIASGSLIPAKAGAGESDLQGHYLRLDNYTFLKAGEQRNRYQVMLWKTLNGAHKALYPNFNSSDPVWRRLVRDARFRRALSLAVNRNEINQVIYYGLAHESSNTVLPGSALYDGPSQQRWAAFDLRQANALLDQMGLAERDSRGVRLRPDGKPLEVVIHTAGESTEETDILELIHDSWLDIGIKIFTKPSQREVFRDRVFSGEAMMSIWSGLENGVPTASMSPGELAPTAQTQLQWPKWGQFHETREAAGEPPDMQSARELLALYESWSVSTGQEQKRDIWSRMLGIYTDEVFSIGIVNSVPQPVVVRSTMQNVPERGVYAWFPTAFFGTYHPDVFWFDE